MTYYSQRTRSKSSKEESEGQSPEEAGVRSQESSAVESCGTLPRCCSPGKLLRHSAPRDLIGGWSRSHLLPSMCQKARLPEGTQVFSIERMVCTDSLGSVSRLYMKEWWAHPPNPGPQTPVQGPPCRQVCLRPARTPLSLFCTHIKV